MKAPLHKSKEPRERSSSELKRAPQHLRRNMRKNRKTIVFAVALVLFLAVLYNMLAGDILRLDYYAYRIFVVRMRRDWLTPIMQSISELALPVVLLVMLLAIQVFAPGRRPGICATINLVGVVVLNQAFKFLVQRPRPEGFRLIAETGYSFPSGHSMVAMAFYGLLAWMAWHYERDKPVRFVAVAGFACIVGMVGISRIYLGVHYASDVIAGFCLALAWLSFYVTVVAPLFFPDEDDDSGGDRVA